MPPFFDRKSPWRRPHSVRGRLGGCRWPADFGRFGRMVGQARCARRLQGGVKYLIQFAGSEETRVSHGTPVRPCRFAVADCLRAAQSGAGRRIVCRRSSPPVRWCKSGGQCGSNPSGHQQGGEGESGDRDRPRLPRPLVSPGSPGYVEACHRIPYQSVQ